jgi:TolB-like protein
MRYASVFTLLVAVTWVASVRGVDVTSGAPATQPAGTLQVNDTPKVLVLPFEQLGKTPAGYEWVGPAIQQNLVAELTRTPRPLDPITGTAAAPVYAQRPAIEAGRAAGARYVAYGVFQIFDQNLRLTGEVIDVATGKAVGSLKSTGTVRDLFAMEDTIATQAKRLLSPVSAGAGQAGGAVAANPALPLAIPATQGAGQQQVTAQQQQQQQRQPYNPVPNQQGNRYGTQNNTYVYYPSQAPYYAYPAYGYGYPAYGYGGYYGGWGYSYGGMTTITRTVHTPAYIGGSMSNSATGMIAVQGRFMPNGELAR